MSDIEPMGEIPYVVAESITAFEHERRKLYDYLEQKTQEDVSVLSYHSQANRMVNDTTSVFAQASTEIVDVYEDQPDVAGFFIARAWMYDSKDRMDFLMRRMPLGTKLEVVELPVFQKAVSEIIEQNQDLNLVYDGLCKAYFTPLASDVGDFLTKRHQERELKIQTMTQDMPLSMEGATHQEPIASGLNRLAERSSWKILRGIL